MARKIYTVAELEAMLKDAKQKKKDSLPFDKKIITLIMMINLIVLFTSFYITLKTGVEPATTIKTWFAFAGAELWALAFIKRGKQKKEIKRFEFEEKEGEF